MRLLPVYQENNGEYKRFISHYNDSPLVGGLDDTVEINDDEAYILATEIWEDINKSGMDDGSLILSFVKYLKIIQSRATAFFFCYA